MKLYKKRDTILAIVWDPDNESAFREIQELIEKQNRMYQMEKLEIKFPAQSIQLITSSILHIPQRQQYEQKAKKSLMKKETSFYRVRSLHGLKMKNSVRLNPLNIFR